MAFQHYPSTRRYVAWERERQAVEHEEALEAARRWSRRPPAVFVHDAERELCALASIEQQAQEERRRWRRETPEGWARDQRGPWAWLAEALAFLTGEPF